MNEIKVEPYIPDEDYDNPAMVVDFYEFTMANCLFLHGFKEMCIRDRSCPTQKFWRTPADTGCPPQGSF